MDEVAPVPVETVALLGKGITPLRLVGTVSLHVYPQLDSPMGELAPIAVGAVALLREVAAEGTLGLD